MSSSALAWSIQDPSRAASSKFQYVMGAGPPSQCAQRLHEHLVLLRISAFAEGNAGHLRGEGPHRGIQSKVPSVLQRPGDLSLMEQKQVPRSSCIWQEFYEMEVSSGGRGSRPSTSLPRWSIFPGTLGSPSEKPQGSETNLCLSAASAGLPWPPAHPVAARQGSTSTSEETRNSHPAGVGVVS